MRRAVNPNHLLRCCPMRGHSSCRRCLCAAEGTVPLGPCRTIRIYIHMCLLWEQGRQITMIRVSRDRTTDFGGEPQAIWVRGRIWGIETSTCLSIVSSSLIPPKGNARVLYSSLGSCLGALMQPHLDASCPRLCSLLKNGKYVFLASANRLNLKGRSGQKIRKMVNSTMFHIRRVTGEKIWDQIRFLVLDSPPGGSPLFAHHRI